jgi:hypothetical protein
MLGNGTLTFREFMTREPLPLATIQNAVLEFLRGRDDVALFGAQAVNAYVEEPRMTQDVDLLSPRATALAEEIKAYLTRRFHIAIRVRELGKDRGCRVYQVRKPKDRHLVDIRPVKALPPTQRMAKVLVVKPAELIATKLMAFQKRRGQPKSGTDWRDLAMLLLTFPELKTDRGPVRERLESAGAGPEVLAAWKELVAAEILPADDDGAFDW